MGKLNQDLTPRFLMASCMFLSMVIVFFGSNEIRYFQTRTPNHYDYNEYILARIISIIVVDILGVIVCLGLIITILRLYEIQNRRSLLS